MTETIEKNIRKISNENNTAEANRSGFIMGTLFGTLLGIGTTMVYQYMHQILQQPRLVSKAVLSDLEDFGAQETRALFIATENLLSGIEERQLANQEKKQILHAGYRNFRESWARDFGFASYGLLALGELQSVRETLDAFFWHQRPDGQLPVKLQSLNVFSRFMYSLFEREQPLEKELVPKYITGHRTPSFDGQALIVISAAEYIMMTQDENFAQEHWRDLKLCLQWLRLHSRPGSVLLHQQAYADWADSVARAGAVLYTNVVFWKALMKMSHLAETMDQPGDGIQYLKWAEQLKTEIQQHLWNPKLGYFMTSAAMDNLSSAGNLLAVAWGLADENQSNKILDSIETANMADPVPTQAAHPAYQRSKISLENRLGNIPNYHTSGAWLWIGAWHIIALCKMGRVDDATVLLDRISNVITRDQLVYEVYGPDGKPLSSFWYTAEAPLTWNAGMLIHAFKVLEQTM
jgi:GH15 family glucan-1,4-alpha-glucosidase